jgi:hypothetical protein
VVVVVAATLIRGALNFVLPLERLNTDRLIALLVGVSCSIDVVRVAMLVVVVATTLVFVFSTATVVDESVVDESVVDESVVDESVVDESVVDESVVDESVVDESVVDESVVVCIGECIGVNGSPDTKRMNLRLARDVGEVVLLCCCRSLASWCCVSVVLHCASEAFPANALDNVVSLRGGTNGFMFT